MVVVSVHPQHNDLAQANATLLTHIHAALPALEALQVDCDNAWAAEDYIYRFWHQSFKLYGIQDLTQRIVDALRALCPPGRELNAWFVDIVAAGTGLTFDPSHNRTWLATTRPMVDAYFHARHMLDMVISYGRRLDEAPSVLPSGWATVLYLYQIR